MIRVTSELESALNIDRPVSWAEHATLGPPFLEQGDVFVDMPVTNCRVRPYKPGPIPGKLVYDRDFKWPLCADKRFRTHGYPLLCRRDKEPGSRFLSDRSRQDVLVLSRRSTPANTSYSATCFRAKITRGS